VDNLLTVEVLAIVSIQMEVLGILFLLRIMQGAVLTDQHRQNMLLQDLALLSGEDLLKPYQSQLLQETQKASKEIFV
jgi:hypothetical protein